MHVPCISTKESVELIKESKKNNENIFDILLAYEIINLYFKKLIEFSELQIAMIEQDEFDFKTEEYLDIFYEDNEWLSNFSEIQNLWRLETKNDLLIAKISDSSSPDYKLSLIHI